MGKGGFELGDWAGGGVGGEELSAQLTHSYAVSFKPASHFLAALALLHLTPGTMDLGYYISLKLESSV